MRALKFLFFALFMLLNSMQVSSQEKHPDYIPPKPPIMGWASWNNYRVEINEDIIKA